MARCNMTRRSYLKGSGKKHHGFTLVELIVVLAIIAILATVGVVTIFGYLKRSRFEQNSQNAVLIYQAAQNALSEKVANGTQDSWTRDLVGMKCSSEEIAAFEADLDQNNESNAMKLSLTFNPKSAAGLEDSRLYNLLTSQFYEKSIFSGTISVEFDVVATYSKGKIYYTAWVSSAFYCRQNSSDTGWDDTCKGSAQDGLPQRDPYEYRRNTSLVGWFDGTADSVTGPDGVCPVHIPQTLINELDGHILADSTESGFLVNLRNGETLDVSWAIFDAVPDEHGMPREDHNEQNLTFTLITEGDECGNSSSYGDVLLSIEPQALSDFRTKVAGKEETVIHECINNSTYITRYNRTALVSVKATSGLETRTLSFPMTISRVVGDDREGCPDPTVGYYEYRLSIDCMIVRADEGNSVDSRFNAERLFDKTPRNISATFSCTFNLYNDSNGTDTKNVADIKAARAVDDPVYFTGVGRVKDETTYCYVVTDGAAKYDDADNDAEGTTGKCVVNTLFGDLAYSDVIGGTCWSTTGGEAVITSFRHLYNIRWIPSGTVNYRIVRNLDWYTKKSGLLTVSEVKVFTCSDGSFKTPAVDGEIKIVSFPALNELKAGQTLTSMSSSTGVIFSINNLQMRMDSFKNNTDLSYGLICTNNGTVYNIYTNNFNLILADVNDGSACDYELISSSANDIATQSTSTLTAANHYVGGLVGLNHGNIGSAEAAASENVIMMSNPVIMASPSNTNYWLTSSYPGVAGIIGKNAKDSGYSPVLSGTLEINGKFAVMGNGNVGGAIAYSNADIGARIVVNGNAHGTSEFTLRPESTTGSDSQLTCVIAGTNNVGGAVGLMENCELEYDVNKAAADSYDTDTGKVTFPDMTNADYQICVDLPENSLILELDPSTSNGANGIAAGGAIGRMNNCSGDYNYMSVYVKNSGNILIRNKNADWNEVGGVIGRDNGSTISTTYIKAVNGSGVVGSLLDAYKKPNNNAEHCGGAYGLLESADGRIIYLNIENNGTKFSAISNNDGDNQGAGGAIGVLKNNKTTIIGNIVNKDNTTIVYYSENYTKKNNGAGGAIGVIQNSDSVYLTDASQLYVENHGYIYANYSAGGAIGSFGNNYGDIYANNINATISGKYDVGGAVGWSKKGEYGKIQSTLDNATVNGIDFIGGAVGRLPNFQDAEVINRVYGSSAVTGTGALVGGVCGELRIQGSGTGLVQLTGNGSLTVAAAGDGVGGVAGVLRSNIVHTVTVKADGVILKVSGKDFVGGAIGKLRSTSFGNSDDYANADTAKFLSDNKTGTNISIIVDVVLPQSSSITGNKDVGGAIGMVHTNAGYFYGSVSVRSASGSSGDTYIGGSYNIGGAVGHFGSSGPAYSDANSKMSVDFTDSAVTIESTCPASDNANAGGAVGFFEGNTDGSSGANDSQYAIDVNLGNSAVTANGSNVGGAIGYNLIKNGNITVSLSGTVKGNTNVGGGIGYNAAATSSVSVTAGSAVINGDGNYVGGAVGLNKKKIKSASADLTGEASVTGNECVGGTVGLLESELTSVTASISGNSFVEGSIYIGGAIGRVASDGQNYDLKDLSVTATINTNYAVRGNSNLGGAVGRVGLGSSSKALTINSISVVMNAGVPIKQVNSPDGDACIGGVVGYHYRGTINSVSLSGNGGYVDTLSGSGNSFAPYKTYDNGMLITGKGNHLGGLIGKSGESSDSLTNAKLIEISATGPAICVVSSNDSKFIGGWIGGCYSTIGGANNNDKKSYDVSTVKVVFSKTEFVGGVFGSFNRYSTTTNIYMKMTVVLSEAIVSGRAAVGGAFGELSGILLYGRIDMTLEKGTRIGDYRGDLGDGTDEEINVEGCYCVEAGGIAGRYSIMNGQNTNGKISLNIVEDEDLSMIFAGSDDYSGINDYLNNPMKVETAGVGGIFGRVKAYGNNTGYTLGNGNCTYDSSTGELEAYAYLISSSRNVAVFSYASNAGGFVGYMPNGTIRGCFSTAVVKAEGQNACVGGFVGKMDKGTIGNSFCGGHTVGGQYIPLYENIVGKNYVGGFAGYLGADVVTIYQCYSTASVRGENYVGGFAGYINASRTKLIDQDYCTGYVFAVASEDDTEERYYGSFAGFVIGATDSSFSNSKVVEAINKDKRRIGNMDDLAINRTRLMLAKWNGSGDDYIRINASSIYHKTAFDSVLQSDDVKFPLRTFVSVQVNGKWEGIHYGDWPIIPVEAPEYILTGDDVSFAEDASTVFNGSLVEPEVVVTKNGVALELGTDYDVVYWRNNKIGKATVIIVGTDPYYGTVPVSFDITSPDINSTEFTIDVATNLPYNNGSEVKPNITVIYESNDRVTTLVEGKDYTLAFENNTDPGQATVKITGIGNYTGEVEREFTILPLCRVTFEAGGETVYVPQDVVKYGVVEEPADPVLTGHTFDGWYANDECTGSPYDFTTVVEGDLTLYAKWIADIYEIRFVANGGVDVDTQNVEYGTTVDTSVMPEQEYEGHTFIGWYSDEACTQAFDLGTAVTGPMTLYALWKENPMVTYDGTSIPSERIAYNSAITKPDDPVMDDYTFIGWFKDAEYQTEFDFSELITADITIYAKWEAKPKVTIHTDTDKSYVVSVDYGSYLTDLNLSEPTKEGGYRFGGWYADPELTELFDFNQQATGDISIYARWIITYTVIIHLDAEETITITYGEGDIFDYEPPERDNLTVIGWYTDEDCTNPFPFNDIVGLPISSNYEIYAKWGEA